jgi:hypothetical protein
MRIRGAQRQYRLEDAFASDTAIPANSSYMIHNLHTVWLSTVDTGHPSNATLGTPYRSTRSVATLARSIVLHALGRHPCSAEYGRWLQ